MKGRHEILVLLAAMLLAFHPSSESESMNPQNPSPCVSALRALVEGRLDAWHGLPTGCSRQDAEAAFGAGDTGPDGVASLAGTLTAFRRYARSADLPRDVQVWLRDDAIFGVEVNDLQPAQSVAHMLGAPEASERSGVGGVHTQRIYAARGLVLHVQNITGAIVRSYGFTPCTLAQFRELPWGQIRIERRPIRSPR